MKYKNSIKKVSVGVVLMIGFFSRLALSKSLDDYHNLSDNLTNSERYEVKKLINGQIDAVFYNKKTNSTIVKAAHYLWKINDKGYITDTLYTMDTLHGSGISLWTESYLDDKNNKNSFIKYIDWIYAGEKTVHSISNINKTKNLSDKELLTRLNNADLVEITHFDSKTDKQFQIALLKENNEWTILDITNRLNSGDDNEKCGEYRKRNINIWKETCIEGYSRNDLYKLVPLNNILPYKPNLKDESLPIFLQKFTRDFYYYEEGFGGWLGGKVLAHTPYKDLPGEFPKSFWYGDGYFDLKHNSELLKFKALVSNKDGRINFNNLSIYTVPEKVNKELKFLEIAYIGAESNYLDKNEELVEHHEKDVGLYVIRKKTFLTSDVDNKIILGQQSTYRIKNSWLPVFTGEFTQKFNNAIWGDIKFYNTKVPNRHYLLDLSAVQDKIDFIPKSLSVVWDGMRERTAYKLHLSNGKHIWLDLGRYTDDVFFEVEFDESDIVEAFKQLNSTNLSVQLEMRMEKIDESSAALSIKLHNEKKSIDLKNISIKYTDPIYNFKDEEDTINFEKRKLKFEYKRALSEAKYIPDFIDTASYVFENSKYKNIYSETISYYSIKLLLSYMEKKDYKSAQKLINNYSVNLLPVIKKDTSNKETINNNSYFASMALAVSILSKNEDIGKTVLDKFLGPDFDVTKENNSSLAYNLACYYSLHKQKLHLLSAMKQALKLGIAVEKFTNDHDFKYYVDDLSFKNALINNEN